MTTQESLSRLSDTALIAEVQRLAAVERGATADLIRSLAELEERQLHLAAGCSSMFTYCTQVLRLSEHAAYGRIAAARAARRFPAVLELLCDGSITLTTVTLLARHLTPENYREVLESARHKSKHDVELIAAALRPQPEVKPSIRKLPERQVPRGSTSARLPSSAAVADEPAAVHAPTPPSAAPSSPPVVKPIAPERYRMQLTISRETRDKLQRAKDLLRHSVPDGDEAVIVDRALTVLLKQLEQTKFAASASPRRSRGSHPRSRHVPAPVRREVWHRDGGRCAFAGAEDRCGETGFLEFHHRVPYADGGTATVDNIELRCRAHNAYEAVRWFGPMLVREGVPTDSYWTRSGPS